MTGSLPLRLPDGSTASVRLAAQEFTPWHGPTPPRTYGSKPIVEHHGQGMFPEVAFAGQLRDQGWGAVWASTFGGLRYFDEQPAADRSNTCEIPRDVERLIQTIAAANGTGARPSYSGMFDVVAWQGTDIRFYELKRAGADRIRDTQRQWALAALRSGVRQDELHVVEWRLLA